MSEQGGDLPLLSQWSRNMSGRDNSKVGRPRILARHRDCNHIVGGQPVLVDMSRPARLTLPSPFSTVSGNRSLSTRRQLSAPSTFLIVSAIASSVAACASGAIGVSGAPEGEQVAQSTISKGSLTASPPAELLDGAAHQNKQYDRQDVLGVEDPKAVVRLNPEIVVGQACRNRQPSRRAQPSSKTTATVSTSTNVT